MPRQFPEIVAYGSAFRFAIEAEQAAADIAAAAADRAPDERWRARCEELARGHAGRVGKLTAVRREVNEMILEPIHALDGQAYLGALDREAAGSWPAVATQLIAAERDAARYHDDFVRCCEDMLAASSRAFTKAAGQDRAAADELSELLAA